MIAPTIIIIKWEFKVIFFFLRMRNTKYEQQEEDKTEIFEDAKKDEAKKKSIKSKNVS